MTIEKKTDGNTTVLYLKGWMDTGSAGVLAEALNGLDAGTEQLVIDMASLEYIASAGLRLLVMAHKQMQGAMTLKNLTPEVMAVLKMTGLGGKLHIEQ